MGQCNPRLGRGREGVVLQVKGRVLGGAQLLTCFVVTCSSSWAWECDRAGHCTCKWTNFKDPTPCETTDTCVMFKRNVLVFVQCRCPGSLNTSNDVLQGVWLVVTHQGGRSFADCQRVGLSVSWYGHVRRVV